MTDSILEALDTLRRIKSPKTAKQVREIVPISEWLESPYYVGEDGLKLYDVWKDELAKVFDEDKPKSEWIVTGSLGSGKSTAGEFAEVRKVYELSCFEPIPYLFNFMKSSTIMFIYFSITLEQAQRTGFGEIRRRVDSIPYFTRRFGRNRDKDKALEFKNLSIIYGSDVGHQVGTHLISALLDEANFMDRKFDAMKKNYSKAQALYNSVLNRRLNRFVIDGVDHGLSVLVSSAATTSSFTEERIEAARDNSRSHVSEVTAFKVKRKEYDLNEFLVFVGTELVDPCLIDNYGDLTRTCEALGTECPEHGSLRRRVRRIEEKYRDLFQWVPSEQFRDSFEKNLLDSIQDVLGISTRPLGKLFQSHSKYAKVIELADYLEARHPFTSEVITISTENNKMIQDFIIEERMGPKNKARCIHVDQSKSNDWTGIASAYVDGYIDIQVGEKSQRVALVRVEFVIVIEPPKKPAEIPIERTRLFVNWLKDNKYRVSRVTYDAWGSVESIQILQRQGIAASHYSVDKDDEPYKQLVTMINQGPRILLYDHPIFRRELFNLDHDRMKGKVDHPEKGSKDAADAVCGAVNNALLAILPEPRIR